VNSIPHWTTYLTALMTPTVAILGLLIGWRQWRLAQNKLKLELFEKRFAVYEATLRFIATILSSGKAEDYEVFQFRSAIREAKWLFEPSVAEYLEKQLCHKAIDLLTLRSELDGVPVGEVRTKNVHAQAEIKKWFLAQTGELDAKFSPYLRLSH